MARAIARFEPLWMIADPHESAEAQRRCGAGVRVVPLPKGGAIHTDGGGILLTTESVVLNPDCDPA